MQNVHKIAKQFAAWHPELLHNDTKNKRFFQIRNIAAMADFTTTLSKNASPCIAVDINPDMQIQGFKRGWRHTIYFLAKGENKKAVDAQAESDTIEKGYKLLNTFVAWCNAHYEKHDQDFLGLFWEGAQAYPYGPLQNGWYAVCLDITDWKISSDRISAFVNKPI